MSSVEAYPEVPSSVKVDQNSHSEALNSDSAVGNPKPSVDAAELDTIDINGSSEEPANVVPPDTNSTAEPPKEDGASDKTAQAPQEPEDATPQTSETPNEAESPASSTVREFPTTSDTRQVRSSTSSTRPSFHRHRAPSLALSTSSIDGEAKPAMLFIKNALNTIKNGKDAKRIPALMQALNRVLSIFDENASALPPPSAIIAPLRIVCAQGSSTEMRAVALDCIGKLFQFTYLEDSETEGGMIDKAVAIVCDTYEKESTDPRVELQIIKALSSAVINEDLVAHGKTLLDAIQQVYNIFVRSRSTANQNTAQVSLTQMVHAVFDRAHRLESKMSEVPSTEDVNEASSENNEKLTLEQMVNTNTEDPIAHAEADLVTKDAVLVFRTLCRLSEKPDIDFNDLKSYQMRSKLLSLHLLHLTLKQHISVFSSKTLLVRTSQGKKRFSEAIKEYLCSSLAQNAASFSPPVFEISAEIFWLLLSNLRSEFKQEIQVFFKEIYFTIMELKSATAHQKLVFLNIIGRLCNDPRALVELYLNYDCDQQMPNIFERLISILNHLATVPVPMTSQAHQHYLADANKHSIAIYSLDQPPSVAISRLVERGVKIELGYYPREYAMKIDALNSMVSVLRSFLLWAKRGPSVESRPVRRDQPQTPDDPSQFETRKSSKKAVDYAVTEFNYKPEKGLDAFHKKGILKDRNDSREIAKILLNTPGLNLSLLGEYLCKGSSAGLLHDFVDQIDFKNLKFLDGLRSFLQKFRLPGESQDIERCVLEFAAKYTQDNPTVFANAEIPYVLAYAVLMLNTELHSPQIKRQRMTLEAFINNNKVINVDGFGLPEAFQREIYEDIKANEIKLISEHEESALNDTKETQDAYLAASEVITQRTAKQFKIKSSEGVYYSASHSDHIHPMMELTWMSFLVTFTGNFQESNNAEIIHHCIQGLSMAARLCCSFEIDLARQSFVQALTNFTNLSRRNDIKPKNVQVIGTLLNLALKEGDYLKNSWSDILLVVLEVSQLEQAADRSSINVEMAQQICSRENVINCDRVFSRSKELTGSAILDFVEALCTLSSREISQKKGLFCLQKIVDICYYNMGRIKLEWSKIWVIMGHHFEEVCSTSDEKTVLFALDSLRQLSFRFLELDELPNFQFQKDFLRPFSYTIKNNPASSVKVLVIECLKQLILSRHDKLKSGWITICETLQVAAGEDDSTRTAAYNLVVIIHKEFLKDVYDHGSMESYLRVVTSLAKERDVKVALHCADLLSEISNNDEYEDIWDLVTADLHDVIMYGQDLEVRSKSLGCLFDTLFNQGSRYSKEKWDQTCRELLFPLFLVLEEKDTPLSDDMSLWISTTLIQALRKIIELFDRYFDSLVDSLEVFFLDLLKTCICQDNATVSRMGATCLVELITDNAEKFNDHQWGQITHQIEKLFRETTAKELSVESFGLLRESNQKPNFGILQPSVTKSRQHLLLVETIDELLSNKKVFDTVPVQDLLRIVECLHRSYDFARTFNKNPELRLQMAKEGYMRTVPNLSVQESTALRVYVKVAMHLYRSNTRFKEEHENRQELGAHLFPVCTTVLQDYNEVQPQDHRHIKALMPMVVEILRHVCELNPEDFKENVTGLYMETIQLLNKDMSSDLREAIQAILWRVAEVHMPSITDENKKDQ